MKNLYAQENIHVDEREDSYFHGMESVPTFLPTNVRKLMSTGWVQHFIRANMRLFTSIVRNLILYFLGRI
jgi:hypothetical protein